MAHTEVVLQGSPVRTDQGVLGFSSVAYVESGGHRILVDVSHYGRRELLLRRLDALRLPPESIDTVVLTHLHWDHALNVDLFPQAEVVVGRAEVERSRTVTRADVHTVREFERLVPPGKLRLVHEATTRLTDEVELVATPGHTSGHLAVFVLGPEGPVLVSGDAAPTARSWTRGRPDLIDFDESAALESMRRMHRLAPSLVVPGHDAPFRFRGERPETLGALPLELIWREDRERDVRLQFGEVEARAGYD